MIPQIKTTDVSTELISIPSKTYKLQIVDDDKYDGGRADYCKGIEYIQSNGNQYIDTGFTFTPNNGGTFEMYIDIQFIPSSFSVPQTIGGIYVDSKHYIYLDYNEYRWEDRGTGRGRVNILNNSNRHYAQFLKTNIIVDDVDKGMYGRYLYDGIYYNNKLGTFSLFARHNIAEDTYTNRSYYKLYSFKIIEDATDTIGKKITIMDLVPAIDKLGKPCLYDKVSHKCLHNMGTQDFIAGTETGVIYNEYKDRIMGYVDKLDAIKQAVYKILSTERYAYLIYSENYGIELDQYIGNTFDYLEANIESTLKDALTYDLRIKDVRVNSIEKKNTDEARIKFTVYSIYGDIQMEVAVSV